MKHRALISLLVIACAAVLVGGATMAWFTDNAEIDAVSFTAGTVAITVDEEATVTPMDNRTLDNVNPGDCFTVDWKIINEGSKHAQFRVRLNPQWDPNTLSLDNVFMAPRQDTGWVLYDEDGILWLYYTGAGAAGVPGTYNPDPEAEGTPLDPVTVPLTLVVAFDGEKTDDDYQESEFTIGGEVEAVQASNNAPSEVWEEAWDTVSAPNYTPQSGTLAADNLEYYLTGPGKDMSCWTGKTDPPGPTDPVIKSFDFYPRVSAYGGNGLVIAGEIHNVVGEDGVIPNGTELELEFTLRTSAGTWSNLQKTLVTQYNGRIYFNQPDWIIVKGASMPNSLWEVTVKIGGCSKTFNHNLP